MRIQQSYSNNSYWNAFLLEDGRKFAIFPDDWRGDDNEVIQARRAGYIPIRVRESHSFFGETSDWSAPQFDTTGSRADQQWQSATWTQKTGQISARGVALLAAAAASF